MKRNCIVYGHGIRAVGVGIMLGVANRIGQRSATSGNGLLNRGWLSGREVEWYGVLQKCEVLFFYPKMYKYSN